MLLKSGTIWSRSHGSGASFFNLSRYAQPINQQCAQVLSQLAVNVESLLKLGIPEQLHKRLKIDADYLAG